MPHTKKLENTENNMNKDKITLAKKTLKLLETQSWEEIKFSSIISNSKNKIIKNKSEALINTNLYFDFLLKKNLSNLEKSSKKDMIFEVIMARLDILNAHRRSIENVIKYLQYNPQEFLKLLPTLIETIILMATLSNIKVNNLKGVINIKGLFVLYILIIFTWRKDTTQGLEKTMTTLDNYLINIDKFFKYLK